MSVTPLRSKDELILAAARLKRAAPTSYKEFEKALSDMTSEAMALCVQSPADQVLVKQGRAQILVDLCGQFHECIEEANKLEAKMKERK